MLTLQASSEFSSLSEADCESDNEEHNEPVVTDVFWWRF